MRLSSGGGRSPISFKNFVTKGFSSRLFIGVVLDMDW